MSATIKIIANDDTAHVFEMPKGVSRHLVCAALRAANEGKDYEGLTKAELDTVAAILDFMRAENEPKGTAVELDG